MRGVRTGGSLVLTWRLGMWVGWLLGFCAGFALAGWLFVNLLAAHAQSVEVAQAIEHAAAEQGVSSWCLYAIAYRESRYLPWVTNASGHRGLFQYADSTWATLSRWAGYEGASPYDPWASAHVAAYTIARPWTGGLRHWGGC